MALQELVQELVSNYGLLGVFVAAIVANATILFPLPMDFAVFAIAAFSTSLPFVLLLGIAAGLGAGIGEMVAYFLGLLGISAAENFTKRKLTGLEGIQFRIADKGMAFIFLAALTPFPFDFIGIVAGLIRYNWAKFFVAVTLGRMARYEIVALAGYFGIEIVKKFFLF